MVLKEWDEIPDFMKNDGVWEYYSILKSKKNHLYIKRIFDIIMALFFLIILSPVFIIIAVCIKLDSKGSVMFRQNRVTQYGRIFKIYKFRTMIMDTELKGSSVTVKGDARITNVGKILRRYRLDEIPQLINILKGEMSFVGTRPEVPKYVKRYTDEMFATLLLPAGVTSEASIRFKDEENLLSNSFDIDKEYVNMALPQKMRYNLKAIKHFNFFKELLIMINTVIYMFKT